VAQEEQRGRPLGPRPHSGADAGSGAAVREAILDARIAAGSDLESTIDFDDASSAVAPGNGSGDGAGWRQSLGGGAARLRLPGRHVELVQQQQQQQQQQEGEQERDGGVPWGAFFSSRPVWAVTVAHFCFNWGYYTLLAWLPSYFEAALGLDVRESSFLTLIP
jgi:hypothetical protein